MSDRKRILAGREALRLALVAAALDGCGGTPPLAQPCLQPPDHIVATTTVDRFEHAVTLMEKWDREGWSEAACRFVADEFGAAARDNPSRRTEALYNAAACHRRCRRDGEALALYEQILKSEPRFFLARVQRALVRLDRDGDVDRAIAEARRALEDGGDTSVEVHVQLGHLLLRRGDLPSALKSLERAMELDPTFLPARNALALYYLQKAKRDAGREDEGLQTAFEARKPLSAAALAPVLQICDAALVEGERYAPIHNTCALALVESGQLDEAVELLFRAVAIDVFFVAATMNLGATLLRSRRFPQAARAFRRAVRLDPRLYEGHVQLALALRAEINDGNRDKQLAEAERVLRQAAALEPGRPEAFFNLGVLLQDYGLTAAQHQRDIDALTTFIDLAKDDPRHADAVTKARERLERLQAEVTGPTG